ncbi:MAG TPA: hypothetical protein VF730_15445 [Terracidiphilus sp.]
MSALPLFCGMLWLQTGGSSPAMTGFWYGAGRILFVVLAILVGFVLLALLRAGKRRP